MENLYEFLNQQSGDRLFGYGIIFLTATYFIMQGLVLIFQSIFSRKK